MQVKIRYHGWASRRIHWVPSFPEQNSSLFKFYNFLLKLKNLGKRGNAKLMGWEGDSHSILKGSEEWTKEERETTKKQSVVEPNSKFLEEPI